jgi:hypothetical protein
MLKALIPSPVEVGREVLILLAGAVIAAAVLYQFPGLRAYVNGAWKPTDQP